MLDCDACSRLHLVKTAIVIIIIINIIIAVRIMTLHMPHAQQFRKDFSEELAKVKAEMDKQAAAKSGTDSLKKPKT